MFRKQWHTKNNRCMYVYAIIEMHESRCLRQPGFVRLTADSTSLLKFYKFCKWESCKWEFCKWVSTPCLT